MFLTDKAACEMLELLRAQPFSIIALLLPDEVVLVEFVGDAREGFSNKTVLGQQLE
jgi:hypothetical protein